MVSTSIERVTFSCQRHDIHDHLKHKTPHVREKGKQMRSRSNLKTATITMLVLVLILAGCDALDPGGDVGFQTTSIVRGSLIFAGHSGASENTTLELRSINVQTTFQ